MGITRACVKHNFLVRDVRDIASTIKKAFYIASTGRPGPVVVDIPKDITAAKCKFEYPAEVHMRSYNPVVKGHQGQIKKAVQLLLGAKRPMIYTGGGVVHLKRLGATHRSRACLGFPITNTPHGAWRYPATDRNSSACPACTVRSRPTWVCSIATCCWRSARVSTTVWSAIRKILPRFRARSSMDIDPSSISKRVRVDVPIVGNVPTSSMNDLLLEAEAAKVDISGWWKQIEGMACLRQCMKYSMKDVIMPQYVIEKLWEVTGGDAIITSDVGQHQMWAAQYYKFDKPRRWLNSGRSGDDGRPALCDGRVAGPSGQAGRLHHRRWFDPDVHSGSSTAKQFGLPIKIINLNNRYLGMVRPVAGDVLQPPLFADLYGF